MQVGGVTEIISHFVGDLRLALENERADVILDGGRSRMTLPDVIRPVAGEPPRLDDVVTPDGRPTPRLDGPLADPTSFHAKLALAPVLAKPIATAPVIAPALPQEPIVLLGGGGGGGGTVHIGAGDLTATQSHVDVAQCNLLFDSDTFGPVIPGLEIAAQPGDLWDLVKAAVAAAPDGVDLLDLQHHEMIGEVVRQLQAMTPESPAMSTMAQGTTIDGVLVSQDAPLSQTIDVEFTNPFKEWTSIGEPPAAEPLPEGEQSVAAGGNTAANSAILVDVSGQTASMIVLGDVYRTNSIAQVNVLHDDDTVVVNGCGTVEQQSGANTVTNTAHFDDVAVYKALGEATGFSGKWTTTFVHGDFYSVQALSQQNWMIDDDIIIRQESSTAFNLVTGLNAGINNGGFLVDGMHYDMIVVGGNLYSTNRIYQQNVVLDDDRIVLSSPDGEGAAWQVSSGGNSLSNEAWIRDIGSGAFQEMSPAARAVAEAAMSGLDTADASKMAGFSAPFGPTLDILVVTGNYYDIHIVSQVNVIGDADTVASLAAAHCVDDTTQIIHTGGNSASNAAGIINVGTLTDVQYAGGQIYEASTLIQTNIVTSDAETVRQSFDALAPEVIAFVEHDPFGHALSACNDALSGASTLHPVTQNPDVMGSIMT